MARSTIKLDDLPIEITVQNKKTMEKYRAYLTEDHPIFSVVVGPQDIQREREALAQFDFPEPRRSAPDGNNDLENASVYHQIAERLPEFDAMLIHGSAIALEGQAYLFLAPSGTGKSTHARLWRERFGGRAVMVNDDKPMLRFRDGRAFICGTPWQGKHDLGNNISVPLRAVCILRRSPRNHIEPLSPMAAFPALLQQCYSFEDPRHAERMLHLAERLAASVPAFFLGCNMEPGAAETAYAGIRNYLTKDREECT